MKTPSPQKQNIQLFPSGWEQAVLLLGVLPALFVFWNPNWITEPWELQLIGEILFLNTVHNAFSIYILWRSKEVHAGISEAYNGRPWQLHIKAIAVFFISIGVIWTFQSKGNTNTSIVYAIAVLLQFLAFHHGMSQQLGLSLMYDIMAKRTGHLSEAEISRLSEVAKFERLFHRVAVLGILVRCITEVGRGKGYSMPGTVLWAGHYIFAAGTAGVIACQFFRPQWKKSNQWLFNLRRAWDIVPMINFQYMALQRFNHAFEYLIVTKSIEKNSNLEKSGKKDYRLAVFLGSSALVAFFYLNRIIFRSGPTPFDGMTTHFTEFFSALSVAITLVHYYYDSEIYRFSQPAFKKNVLPLLLVKNFNSKESV